MSLLRDINRKINKIERTSRSINNTIGSLERTRNRAAGRSKKNSDSENTWVCSCGKNNIGNFCSECGKGPITCTKCTAIFQNPVKFCEHCGEKITIEG